MLWGFGLSVQIYGKPFPVWGSHNNAPLTVELSIYEENNQSVINILVKDSDEETNFLRDFIYVLSSTDTINITNTTDLENAVNIFARALEELWGQYSKHSNITRHSKQ